MYTAGDGLQEMRAQEEDSMGLIHAERNQFRRGGPGIIEFKESRVKMAQLIREAQHGTNFPASR